MLLVLFVFFYGWMILLVWLWDDSIEPNWKKLSFWSFDEISENCSKNTLPDNDIYLNVIYVSSFTDFSSYYPSSAVLNTISHDSSSFSLYGLCGAFSCLLHIFLLFSFVEYIFLLCYKRNDDDNLDMCFVLWISMSQVSSHTHRKSQRLTIRSHSKRDVFFLLQIVIKYCKF